MASYIEFSQQKLDWAMSFQRTGGFPLDRTDLFASYADAVKYAAGNTEDPDSRGLCGSSYIGQIVTVFENDVITVYKIEADRSLSEVGTATAGDGKSITLNDGILSLAGFDAATAGQQPRIVNKGTADAPNLQLEWYTPDTSTVAGLQEALGALQNTVGDASKGLVKDVNELETTKANKADVYTKSEVDGKLTSALHYKGSYDSFSELTTAVADGTITPIVGDVYNIKTAGGTDAQGVAIKAGDNVIYNNESGWDVTSGTIDLSEYYSKTEINTKLDTKVDKVDGSRLLTTEEAAKIAASTKVTKSNENGRINIDDVEVTVYTLPTASTTTAGGIKTSTTNNGISVSADGIATVNAIDASKIDGVIPEASKVTNSLTIGTVSYNGSSAVSISADDIPLPETLVHDTDIANETTVGLVKGSAAQDSVAVDATGTMSVNDISASKIKGTVAEATKVANGLKVGAKTYDGSSAVEVTATDLNALTTTDAESTYVKKTQIATGSTAGLVKGSTAKNTIAVGADGTMTVNTIDGSKIEGAIGDADSLGGIAATDILVQNGSANTSKVKRASAADKLNASVDIGLNGDVTGTASFDGSMDITIAATLKNTGTAGTYTKVMTDAKGRVISGENLVPNDIPNLTLAKITDAGGLAKKDKVARTDLDTTIITELTDLGTNSHTHTNKAILDGITSSKVTSWDSTASKIDSKADSATTLSGYGITDAYTKSEVDGKVSGAYHFKGSYTTFTDLITAVTDGTITPAAGHVYNIETGGGTDKNGNAIKSGDNVAYVEGEDGGWDVLGGTMDLSAYATTSAVNTALSTKADKTVVNAIDDRVGDLETVVGDATQGLVKTVADHTTAIGSHDSDIASLTSDVTAVTTKATANETAITKLNGDASTEGSVKNLIAASATDINTAITNITKSGGTIDTKITAHNTAADAHATQFAAKADKSIQRVVSSSDLVWADPGASDIINFGSVGTLTMASVNAVNDITVAGVDYTVNAVPVITTMEERAAVLSAKFMPMVSYDTGVIKFYANNAPSADFNIVLTFTQVQTTP